MLGLRVVDMLYDIQSKQGGLMRCTTSSQSRYAPPPYTGGLVALGGGLTRADTDTVELTVKTLLRHLITRKFDSPTNSLRAPHMSVPSPRSYIVGTYLVLSVLAINLALLSIRLDLGEVLSAAAHCTTVPLSCTTVPLR
eukprot:9474837-Pyramimonas_sp.AAC.1